MYHVFMGGGGGGACLNVRELPSGDINDLINPLFANMLNGTQTDISAFVKWLKSCFSSLHS